MAQPVYFLDLRLKLIEGRLELVERNGAVGPQGPIGPMPLHQWRNESELRFQLPDGWGEWHDLRGPSGHGSRGNDGAVGPPGPQGVQGARGAAGIGGGSSSTAMAMNWFFAGNNC